MDVVFDLKRLGRESLPFEDDTFDEIYARDVLDRHPAPTLLMSELYRIAKPGCQLVLQGEHGASDAAWTNPAVLRPYFPDSFQCFGQPFYWRLDEGYDADWQVTFILLKVNAERYKDVSHAERMRSVQEKRNVVEDMTAVLVAMKPPRPRDRKLLTDAHVEILLDEN